MFLLGVDETRAVRAIIRLIVQMFYDVTQGDKTSFCKVCSWIFGGNVVSVTACDVRYSLQDIICE